MNKTSKIIAAFTIGAAAGSILGMLLAPDKYRENCKKAKGGKAEGMHGEAETKQSWTKERAAAEPDGL